MNFSGLKDYSHKRSLKYLRRMTADDLPEVMRVELAAYPHPWKLKNFEDCIIHPQYSCWIFENEKEVCGHVILSIAVGEAHLLNICVHPEKQGKGWGRKLLEEAEWIAIQHKAENCFLEVRVSNKVGLNLYESVGYNEIGYRKAYYPGDKGREDAIIMAKALFS